MSTRTPWSERPLLAKSAPKRPGQDPLTLLEHSCQTEQAARELFRLNSRWGQNFCRFFGLVTRDQHARFLLNLRVAALFHDIGKANEHFQRAVQTTGAPPQTLRHEHLSALILCLDSMRSWLSQNSALDIDVITAAVLSHHLKATGIDHPLYRWCDARVEWVLDMFLEHPQVADILERVREVSDLPAIPTLPTNDWSENPPWSTAFAHGMSSSGRFRRKLKRAPQRHSLLLAVKAGVIVADSAASGLFRTGHSITDWIDDVAHKPALSADDLDTDIIRPRCDALSKKNGRPFAFHEFQRCAATLGPRALLLAGCGSGKTLAAWNWARTQLADHALGHVLFLYPTRGTATEGFRDYVGWAPEADAALVHGTSEYELAGMRDNPSEAMRGKSFQGDARLFALGLWSRRYFSATVDQFLAFLEHRYESMCLLPLLADSAVILDEVHSYDRAMFDNLIAFLKYFHGPVLCMTATLPVARRKQLENRGLRVYPQTNDRQHLRDLEALETHPRYRIRRTPGPECARTYALNAYRQGRRVLWVVNTVARCQTLAHELSSAVSSDANTGVLAYHSRYRMLDRRRIHAHTVAAFQQAGHPALAVTTQVCEMSLDLDADVLITELAPISSLVQRLGRANRHARPGTNQRADVLVYEPDGNLPYSETDMNAARRFLDDILASSTSEREASTEVSIEVSQRRLADALEQFSLGEVDASEGARFVDSGYFAIPGSFRDGDDFSAQCILDSDLAALEPFKDDRRRFHRELPAYLLGVPKGQMLKEPELPSWLPSYIGLASATRYRADLGFVPRELIDAVESTNGVPGEPS